MDAEELAAAIEDILDDPDGGYILYRKVKRTGSFEARGVLTQDNGLVVDMTDGSQFQITVVKSR